MAASVKYIKNRLDEIEVAGPRFTAKSVFSQARVTFDGKPLRMKLQGHMFMLPQKQEHDQYGIRYSIGCEFNEDDLVVLESVYDKLKDNVDDDFSGKEVHNEGAVFFKLPTNKAQSEFDFDNNLGLKPMKLNNDKLERQMLVTFDLIVSGWYKSDSKQFGLSYKFKKIHFGAEKKSVKRRKLDDEEIEIKDESSTESIEEFGRKKYHMSKKDQKIVRELNN